MSDINVTKRVEPSIHSSTLDGHKIINQHPPRSREDAENRAAQAKGDGQPFKTERQNVVIKGAPLEVTMGGSGAVVVRRPPMPGQAPKAVVAIPSQVPQLSADQAQLCAFLIKAQLDVATRENAPAHALVLHRSTLAVLEKIAPPKEQPENGATK